MSQELRTCKEAKTIGLQQWAAKHCNPDAPLLLTRHFTQATWSSSSVWYGHAESQARTVRMPEGHGATYCFCREE